MRQTAGLLAVYFVTMLSVATWAPWRELDRALFMRTAHVGASTSEGGVLYALVLAFSAITAVAFTACFVFTKRFRLGPIRRCLPWILSVLSLCIALGIFIGAQMLTFHRVQPQISLISFGILLSSLLCGARASQGEFVELNSLSPDASPSISDKRRATEFSVFMRENPSARSVIADVWVYRLLQRDLVRQRAMSLGRAAENISEVDTKASILVPGEATLQIALVVENLQVTPPLQYVSWRGRPTNATFRIAADASVPQGVYPASISVDVDGLRLTTLLFDVAIGALSQNATEVPTRTKRIESAFASYASRDRAEVLKRIQGIAHEGVDVFIDIESLRGGEKWEPRLYGEIDRREALYLFWSKAASGSPWVEREWRHALSMHGLDFISPIPLVDPRIVRPPHELEALHFNDRYLSYFRAEAALELP